MHCHYDSHHSKAALRSALAEMLFLLLLLLLFQTQVAAGISNESMRIQNLVEKILAPPYNPSLRPGTEKRQTDVINISMYFLDFANFNEMTMDFTTSVYFRRLWYDDRLKYNSSLTDVLSIGFMEDKVWRPDIYFLNEKSGTIHSITVPNILLQVFPDGRTILSNKYSLVMTCKFQLELYPMDSQTCNIDFGSYGYRTSDIILRWIDKNGVLLSDSARSLPEYDVVKTTQHDCTTGYEVTGRYTCLRATLHMKRKFNYYLIQVYVPSILIVVLSWVSFWIDHNATPARITLGLLTVLTVTTQSSGIRSDMPRVSYVKAIDVWLTGCLTFVFMALIEFAVVNVVQRRPTRYRTAPAWRKPQDLIKAVRNLKMQQEQQQQQQQQQELNGVKSDGEEKQEAAPQLQQQQQQQTATVADEEGPSSGMSEAEAENNSSCCMFRHKKRIMAWLTCQCYYKTPNPNAANVEEEEEDVSDAEFVDFLAKYIFPGSFLIFNAVYWTYYKVMEAYTSPR